VIGLSSVSTEVALLSASVPDAPSTPTTVLNTVSNSVSVTWTPMSNNGAILTGFRI
jgi:hypothetical protein